MSIVSIIPARGGSKGVPKKNIALLGGYPLIAYSIVASKLSARIQRTIVSTDSREIADIAVKFGAEVPFFRPAEFARDRSLDADVFRHAVGWFRDNEKEVPDILVQLRPTTPLRDPAEIDRAIGCLEKNARASGLRSGHELSEPPHKMFQLNADGYFEGFFPNDPRPEYYNLPRQVLPKAYSPNGYVDLIKTKEFMSSGSLYGAAILGFVTAYAAEVDTQDDFQRLAYLVQKNENVVYRYLKEHY
ncbi:MAG: acylneuraminate cytidylyltransferase family protein [Candidatus Omnitrophica bacterium]|nr:acylneuraminate cytidylyltransferase family protein [Candidatus Omnitrophota bacterium]